MPSSVSRKRAERLDAAHDHQEIVLAGQREHRVDQIVPRALVAQIDFEAVGEEGEEVDGARASRSRAPTGVEIRRVSIAIVAASTFG